MCRILAVDDDRIILKIITTTLRQQGYEIYTASNGREGLLAAKTKQPDVIITDMMMPEMDGIEFSSTLRQDPAFANTPVLMLTSQSDLEDKLNAFDAGVDDYLHKPFDTAELIARITVLLRHAERIKASQANQIKHNRNAHTIAVHSLRGGVGCSSIATNLAIGLATIWQEPTLLMDMNMTSGQIALMLNKPKKRTWADLARYQEAELDIDAVKGLIGKHESGLSYILSPPTPIDSENLDCGILNSAVSLLRTEFEYTVADLPHDFSEKALNILDNANYIVLLVSPELASVYSASIALDMYKKLGYSQDNIKLVVNWTFERDGLSHKKIMSALKHPISFVVPFAPTQFIGAINHGNPLLYHQPDDPIATLLEDFSFRLSKPRHQKKRPFEPSEAWQRVAARLQQSNKEKEKKKERKRWSFS